MKAQTRIMLTALFGLSIFTLGLAVGQGWFTPQPAQAQFGDTVYPGPTITYFVADPESYFYKIVDIDGYVWSLGFNSPDPQWVRGPQILPPNSPIPASSSSVGGLKGSYNK